jgi:hypothetical protein
MGLKTNSDTLPGDKSFFPLSGGGLIPTPAASTFPPIRDAYYWSYRQGIQVYIEERP